MKHITNNKLTLFQINKIIIAHVDSCFNTESFTGTKLNT